LKIVDINPQEFTKLYNEGVSFRILAKKYGCGTTKIHSMRVQLDLPVRGNIREAKTYHPKNIDEKHFRELYEAGLSYQAIGEAFGITTVGTVARYVRVFGLPERDRTLARIDKEKFKKMYLDGCSMRGLAKEFRMNQLTTQRVITALDLPERTGRTKPLITAHKLKAIEFKEPDDSLDDSLNDSLDDSLDDNFDEPVRKPNKFFSVPTLRELEKKQQAFDMIRAEQEYKNRGRNNERN
jgi:hypothetical protein